MDTQVEAGGLDKPADPAGASASRGSPRSSSLATQHTVRALLRVMVPWTVIPAALAAARDVLLGQRGPTAADVAFFCLVGLPALVVLAAVSLLRSVASAALHEARAGRSAQPSRWRRVILYCCGASPLISEMSGVVASLVAQVETAERRAMAHNSVARRAVFGSFEVIERAMSAEERVRNHLVAELHDTMAQDLAVAGYTASEARELLAESESGAQADLELAELLELVHTSVLASEKQLRQLLAHTRPVDFSTQDLGSALDSMLELLCERHGLDVAVRWPTVDLSLRRMASLTIYRFIQEATRNVVKHAPGATVRISFAVEEASGHLVTRVVDNGPGFDAENTAPGGGHHLGLAMMRERAHLLGGKAVVQSRPGAGTVAELRLPLGLALARPAPVKHPTATTPAHASSNAPGPSAAGSAPAGHAGEPGRPRIPVLPRPRPPQATTAAQAALREGAA